MISAAFMLLPATQTTHEKNFSMMRKISKFLRLTLNQKWYSDLMVVFSEIDVMKRTDYNPFTNLSICKEV